MRRVTLFSAVLGFLLGMAGASRAQTACRVYWLLPEQKPTLTIQYLPTPGCL